MMMNDVVHKHVEMIDLSVSVQKSVNVKDEDHRRDFTL